MLRYVGKGRWVPGYPTYDLDEADLTDEEIEMLVKTGAYKPDQPKYVPDKNKKDKPDKQKDKAKKEKKEKKGEE